MKYSKPKNPRYIDEVMPPDIFDKFKNKLAHQFYITIPKYGIIDVLVWKNSNTVQHIYNGGYKGTCKKNERVQAFVTRYKSNGNQIGVLHLDVNNIDLNVLAHECVHLGYALFIKKNWKIRTTNKSEETMAYFIGDIFTAIHEILLKLSVKIKPK